MKKYLIALFILLMLASGCAVKSEQESDTAKPVTPTEPTLEWSLAPKEDAASFYQITQLPFPDFWGGAAYSIRTPSGELYLVDGGFQEKDSPRIAEHIAENGSKVKGWILTHPHVDHIGAFLDYMALYPDTVETVYYSPFTTEFFEEEEDPEIYKVLNNAILYYEFLACMEATREQVEYIPMITGDTIMMENLKLECFHSFDPNLKDVNGNSLVFTLSLQDFTMLLTGDMTEATLTSILENTPEDSAFRNVDVIQIPHHGYLGGITTESLYLSTGAELALLDCTKGEYDNNSAQIQTTVQLMESLELPFLTRFSSENGNSVYLYPDTLNNSLESGPKDKS